MPGELRTLFFEKVYGRRKQAVLLIPKSIEILASDRWRECAACSEGDAIPDLTADSLHNLNPWIVTKVEKYPDPRAARLEIARQMKQATEELLRKTPVERNRKLLQPRSHRQPVGPVKKMGGGIEAHA